MRHERGTAVSRDGVKKRYHRQNRSMGWKRFLWDYIRIVRAAKKVGVAAGSFYWGDALARGRIDACEDRRVIPPSVCLKLDRAILRDHGRGVTRYVNHGPEFSLKRLTKLWLFFSHFHSWIIYERITTVFYEPVAVNSLFFQLLFVTCWVLVLASWNSCQTNPHFQTVGASRKITDIFVQTM